MNKQYTLKDFIRMTIPQKERLYKRDKQQYLKLKGQSDSQYSTETDHEALAEMNQGKKAK